MTYNRLPGTYFTETVAAIATERNTTPFFIVQTSQAIADIDGQIVSFTNYETFKTVVTGKGLNNTLAIMEEILTEAGMMNSKFYVYSVKTDTAAAFTNILTDSANYSDMYDVIYIEETKSSTTNNIASKMGALKSGANTCYNYGANRIIHVIPQATVADAVANKSENVTDTSVVISTFESMVDGINSGRVTVYAPDYAGAMVGHAITTDADVDVGFEELNTAITNLRYNFTHGEMLTLQNLGVMFVRGEKIGGNWIYRINLGVTTAFAGNGADGLLVSRRVADNVLQEVKYACDAFVKAPEDIDGGLVPLQTDIDNILDRFVAARDIVEDESELIVSEAGDVYSFNVTGKIKPIKSTIAINVNTTLA